MPEYMQLGEVSIANFPRHHRYVGNYPNSSCRVGFHLWLTYRDESILEVRKAQQSKGCSRYRTTRSIDIANAGATQSAPSHGQ